jgi:uncharacterized LabA/DUF88 family protein
MSRVVGYIDGFNLFFGMRDSGLRRYYWLDPAALIRNLLKPDQRFIAARYFTARISANPGDPAKHLRQQIYLEALGSLPDVECIYGHYLSKTKTCLKCSATWQQNEEKMTDVNIAVRLLTDAIDDSFDTAIIVSADSDLVAPVEAVRTRFPKKRVIVACPPDRHSAKLESAANASFTIGRKKLLDSQLPDRITKPDGYVLERPPHWR